MKRASLARSSLIIAASLVLSQLTGLGRNIIINSQFGAGAELSAFQAAFRVTDFLFSILAGGALASAFVPIFAGHLANHRARQAWALARATTLCVFAALIVVAITCGVLAEPLLHNIVVPGFSPEQIARTAGLLRIMLISTVIFGVSGLLMGVLQSNDSFLAPALAPSFYNIGIMLGVALLGSALGIEAAGIGVVVGASLHLAVQLPALIRVVARDKSFASIDPINTTGNTEHSTANLLSILRLMLPRMLGLGLIQINFIVNTNLASYMGDTALAAINIAFTLMLLPQAAIAQSIATALFPAISAQVARGEHREFRASLLRATRMVLVMAIPATVGLLMMGKPIIALLFERGKFDAASTQAVAFALTFYALGLVAHCVYEILARGFYALKDTRRPLVVSAGGVAVNIALSFLLSREFARAGLLAFGGLALANSLATWLEVTVLAVWLISRAGYKWTELQSTSLTTMTSVAAALAMAVALWLATQALGSGPIATVVISGLGAIVFGLVALLVRNREITDLTRFATTRLALIATNISR